MLSKRETQILKLLFDHRHTYLTSQEIASGIDVSNRTARKYLHLLEDALKKEAVATIDAKQGNGYQLKIEDSKKFDVFYLNEVKEQSTSKDITTIQESNDRQYYILNRLFFEQSAVYVDAIADELFVSRSTISNDLVEIKKLITPYQIELQSKSNKGIFVVGNEQNIRHFIMNYFFMDRLHDNLFAFSMYANLLEGISVEEIVIIVLDECRESQLKLSDFIVYNLVLHIGLAIKRIQNGFLMDIQAPIAFDEDSIEYQTALKILARIEQAMGLTFSSEEADFIALHLKNKITAKTIFQKADATEAEIRSQLLETLKAIDQDTPFDLEHDTILIDGLMIHFIPLLTRLQNNSSIENPLLEEIKSQYPDLYELTVNYFSKMPIFSSYRMTEGEWAYLAIHITAAVERYFNDQKTHVLVICATGLGSSQMIKNRLEREFGSRILIEKVISYYEIAEQDLSQIDLIISSINLGNIVLNAPIVNVSVFLGEEDIKKINHEISSTKGGHFNTCEENKQVEMVEEKVELIKRSFQSELFYFADKRLTKETVLKELIGKIEAVEQNDLQESFLNQLKLRESYSSVVFSEFMAVPHPIEALTNEGYVAVAVVPEGIDWSEEYQKIQLVFLLSPDKLGKFEIDKVSQMLVEIMEDDSFRKALAFSDTFDNFIKAFIDQFEKTS
ncbi:BglG family transcription antiterminator [Enterococcus raffinosus]|uniref:BglG family transcription antiterminator n=1 Tax=Enterococcus raffinosus TaxID=71452 RepID=A0AAW8T407_9ENTE|nr:BglG family transcription antiterminator [Enterococcus raffinosus]MDT2522167.1 BglG family transcription antiterminator [Enterococcus raffinosus]MDT2533354.1 BglG family transcription antiterminator [Enterococcus raffinosus]MDT2543244.1 BglG family transcription antiterminator [Enterococcus raffinosus]MDT2554292.1 BglG family transcription antiterminator [Enterococcus raffinosus]MDT2576940.1 BglG family transcription antiterminator [Enterococcus raffinosus]